jgi:hypothetical protein
MADFIISGVISLIHTGYKTLKDTKKFSNQLLVVANQLNTVRVLFESNKQLLQKKKDDPAVQSAIKHYELSLQYMINFVKEENKETFYAKYKSVEESNGKLKDFYSKLADAEQQLLLTLSFSSGSTLENIKDQVIEAEKRDLEILGKLDAVANEFAQLKEGTIPAKHL